MQQRKTYIDALRIVAIFGVLYNHTNRRGYYLYAFSDARICQDFYIGIATLAATAVPIFFMISGALLLPKKESLKELFQKRILKMVLVLLVFSGIQYVLLLLEECVTFSRKAVVQAVLQDGVIPSYWFLYAYIAYLLLLPILRKVAEVMSKQDYFYLFALLLLVEGFLPMVLNLAGIGGTNYFFSIPFLNPIIIYPLLGYYLEQYMKESYYNKKTNIIVGLCMAVVVLFFIAMTQWRGLPYEEFTTYDKGLYTCSFTMLLDVGIYYFVKYFDLRKQHSMKYDQMLHSMGECAFGIYLIEQPIRERSSFIYDGLSPVIGRFPACIVWVICIFIVAYSIVAILRRIPVVRKLI
ncbi:MAG: acyltransferase [Lachnospiraceae bacterium]